jgi:hypothetical protein
MPAAATRAKYCIGAYRSNRAKAVGYIRFPRYSTQAALGEKSTVMKKNLIASLLLFAASEALSTPACAATGYRMATSHVPLIGAGGQGSQARAGYESPVKAYRSVRYTVSRLDSRVRFDTTQSRLSHAWSRFRPGRA